jgi:multidrug efflux system membrane fusion protein
VDNVRLQLEYCTVRSPLDGYAGKVLLQKGNLAKANDVNPLVIINQVRPIYVNFAVPEQMLPSIREYMARAPLQVEASPPGSDRPPAVGTLDFVDNAVDAATGTIKLKAVFPNQEGALWPGQFVNASLKLYDQKNALVVPAQAVQVGPKGQYVYVVTPGLVAEIRPVAIERTDMDKAIVASGVKEGEAVVVKGQLRLTQGAKVVIAKPTTGKP